MRVIDADALIYGLRDYTFTLNPDDPNATKEYSLVSKMIEILENAPTIEPQPQRKKGKWIEYDNSHCECPFCHEEWSYFNNEVEYFNYCPNCGARMEENR